jgi:hypothetical protein
MTIRPARLLIVLTIFSGSLSLSSALAQPGPSAEACIAELDRVQEALDEEDSGVALVLLDMSSDICDPARAELQAAIEADPALTNPALTSYWQMELKRVALLTALGSCDDARDTLRQASAAAELPSALHADFAQTSHAALRCGPVAGVASGGTISVSPGFSDVVLSGTAIGEQDASTLGSHCWGWIPAAPSYALEVSEAMQVSLTAYSAGGSDLVLAVTGPGGTFCNDDWDGLNPGMSEYFTAGTYDVYVGEYSSGGWGSDYTLTISSAPLVTPPSALYPTYGSASVGPSYGRTTLSGNVWGTREAATAFDSSCAGWVAEQPDFDLYVDISDEVWVTVTGAVGSDLTLVVDGPGGRFCDDNTSGLNPSVNAFMTAGTYHVWIGDKAGASTGASYGIQFAGYDPMLVLETDPAHGTATLGPNSDPVTLPGEVTGEIPASDFFGTSCYGSIEPVATHRLVVSEAAQFEIVSRTTSGADLVIVVSGPAGTFCNDDYEGLNPGVRRYLTAGEYVIHVGQLSGGGFSSTLETTITASEGTPPLDLATLPDGEFGSVTMGPGYGTSTLAGTSGGPEDASDLDPACHGHITEAPSFIMDVDSATSVSIQVLAEGDTTLVMLGPDGTYYCNDDAIGLNPALQSYYLEPGRYGIWVGSYSSEGAHSFMISFTSEYW